MIWAQASVARASQSGPEMFIGTMIDITESKQAQESLLATQSELARVSQLTLIGQMTASIAHEIKQPITSIVMGASAGLRWLAKEPPNLKEVQACLELIAKNGDRSHHVVDGVRAMFLKHRQEREFLDFNQIIRDTLELVRSDAQKKRIVLQSELSEDLRPVFGNRIQLQQVMLNLFSNAIEAMDSVANGVRQLRVSSTSFAPESVLIAVANSGPGLAPKDVNHIFDPFFTTKSRGHGNGSGDLPVARGSPQWQALRPPWRRTRGGLRDYIAGWRHRSAVGLRLRRSAGSRRRESLTPIDWLLGRLPRRLRSERGCCRVGRLLMSSHYRRQRDLLVAV